VDKVALVQVFSEYFSFPWTTVPYPSVIWDWSNRPVVAAVPSRLGQTPISEVLGTGEYYEISQLR
jgi:hypothetical protein